MTRTFTPRRKMTRSDWVGTAVCTVLAAAAVVVAWFGLPLIGIHL